MSLIDTTDSILMLGAYGWAFVKPIRKLYYNLTITAVSVVVAVLVGGLEAANLIGDQARSHRRRRLLGRDRRAERQFRHARLSHRRHFRGGLDHLVRRLSLQRLRPARSRRAMTVRPGASAGARSGCRRARISAVHKMQASPIAWAPPVTTATRPSRPKSAEIHFRSPFHGLGVRSRSGAANSRCGAPFSRAGRQSRF